MYRTALLALPLACALAQADSAYQNLSTEQARTLLRLARDFDAENERPPAAYQVCIAPFDAQAQDPAQREQMQDALKVVDGAARRMGYPNYPDITDDYERLRLAKMLGSSGWLKQFRTEVTGCLAR